METLGVTKAVSDIFFKDEYIKLYEDGSSRPETFSYRKDGDTFNIAYLKRPIPASDYYDFETAYGYGGPLSSTCENNFLSSAWADFHGYCKRNMIIGGFIRFNPIINNHRFIDPKIVEVSRDRKIVLLSLDGMTGNEATSQYREDNKNKIRLAVRSGAKIRENSNTEFLAVFKDMYYETMDRLNAETFYYFSDEFFAKIDLFLKNSYKVFVAYLGDKPVGCALVFFTHDVLTYFLSATTGEGRKVGAANLLRHYSINFAIDRKIRFINFGGGRSSSEDDSLLRFKKGFTENTVDFYIGKFLVNKKEYDRFCEEWARSVKSETIRKEGGRFLKYRYL